MIDRPHNVLFLCTGNTARSILAEGLLRKDGAGRFQAYSAGSQPKGLVHPLALETLLAHGYPSEGFRSKSWDEFTGPDAPEMDFVVTVCDSAAGEACPYWPGDPMRAHWGLPDPAAVAGAEEDKREAFDRTFRLLRKRIAALVALPVEKLDKASLHERLRAIGGMEGATAKAVR